MDFFALLWTLFYDYLLKLQEKYTNSDNKKFDWEYHLAPDSLTEVLKAD